MEAAAEAAAKAEREKEKGGKGLEHQCEEGAPRRTNEVQARRIEEREAAEERSIKDRRESEREI